MEQQKPRERQKQKPTGDKRIDGNVLRAHTHTSYAVKIVLVNRLRIFHMDFAYRNIIIENKMEFARVICLAFCSFIL